MKLLKKIKRKLQRDHNTRLYKHRCKKLNIPYVKGVYIGKNVQNRGAKVTLGENSKVHDNTIFWGDGNIIIGANTSIGENSWIYASKNGGVTIGDNVNCDSHLYIIDSDHCFSDPNKLIDEQPIVSKPIIIGNDIWIAYNVTILKGTIIKEHSVVGACTLCNKEYPEHSVIVGVPGKILTK